MSDFYFPAFDEFDLDDSEQALAEFMLRLRLAEEKIGREFDDAADAWAELEEVRTAIAAEHAAMEQDRQTQLNQQLSAIRADPSSPRDLAYQYIYTPGLGNAELREQACLLRAEASAGSLILMLDEIVQRLRHTIGEKDRPQPAQFELASLIPLDGYVSTMLYAAGNAYRHTKDWEGLVNDDGIISPEHRQYKASARTLEILGNVIGYDPIAANTVCVATLTALCRGSAGLSFQSFWEVIKHMGDDFARRYCNTVDALTHVMEALNYQDAMNSMEVSFSMDERLYRSSRSRFPEDGRTGSHAGEPRA